MLPHHHHHHLFAQSNRESVRFSILTAGSFFFCFSPHLKIFFVPWRGTETLEYFDFYPTLFLQDTTGKSSSLEDPNWKRKRIGVEMRYCY